MLEPHLPAPHAPGPDPPRALETGWPDVDALRVFRPGALTLVDVGTPTGHDLVFSLLVSVVAEGREALVADGGNALDVHRLVAAARRRALSTGGDRGAARSLMDLALDRVRVARGFTAHQLQSIVEDGLPAAADATRAANGANHGMSSNNRDSNVRTREPPGLILALDLPTLYLDEDLARREARTLLARALDALRTLAQRTETPAVVTNRTVAPGARNGLRNVLDAAADELVAILPSQGQGERLVLPRRGATFLLSPAHARQTRLSAFGNDPRAPPRQPPPGPPPAQWPHRAASKRWLARTQEGFA